MVDKPVHLLELFFRVVFQQMRVVFAKFHHFYHVVIQRWRLELAVGFFTQMEDGQACGEVLVVRRIAGNQVRSSFDNGLVNIGRFDAVIELDMGTQFHLRDGYITQPLCRPIQHPMNFVEIDAFSTTITLCHQQTLIHVKFTCP